MVYFTKTDVILFLYLLTFQKHLTCMDSGDSSFGQNDSPTVLPIPAAETDESLTSQDMPETLPEAQTLHAEQFRLLDPNGQPVQYDLQPLGDSNAQMVGVFYN